MPFVPRNRIPDAWSATIRCASATRQPEMRQELIEPPGFIADLLVKTARSASRVNLASPQCSTAIPPMKQKRQLCALQKLWISSAASSSRLLPATLMAAGEDALHFDQAGATLARFI